MCFKSTKIRFQMSMSFKTLLVFSKSLIVHLWMGTNDGILKLNVKAVGQRRLHTHSSVMKYDWEGLSLLKYHYDIGAVL